MLAKGKLVVTYDDGHAVSAPVGSYDTNDYGIFDLGGNVDDPTPEEVVDSSGARTGDIDLPPAGRDLLAGNPALRWLHPRPSVGRVADAW